MSVATTPDQHLPLHPEAFRILLALLDGEAHGYAIVKELEKAGGSATRVLPANLYRRIRTLRDQGLIEEADSRPDAELDDERRRYFAVTSLGMEVARQEARRLEALVVGARARNLLSP